CAGGLARRRAACRSRSSGRWRRPGRAGRRCRPPRSVPSRRSLLLGVLRHVALVGGERGDERLLRDLDGPDVLHALLALLLLLQELALARDVAAVALGQHVLAHRTDVLAGDDAGSDGGLDRDLELLARDQLLQLAGHLDAVVVGLVAV